MQIRCITSTNEHRTNKQTKKTNKQGNKEKKPEGFIVEKIVLFFGGFASHDLVTMRKPTKFGHHLITKSGQSYVKVWTEGLMNRQTDSSSD